MSDDLIAWLRDVLDEDEQIARAAPKLWRSWLMVLQEAQAHVARFDPPAMLADIEAKRAILDRYERLASDPTFNQPTTYGQQIAYEAAITCIASAYRDRDGYRDEWRP